MAAYIVYYTFLLSDSLTFIGYLRLWKFLAGTLDPFTNIFSSDLMHLLPSFAYRISRVSSQVMLNLNTQSEELDLKKYSQNGPSRTWWIFLPES